MSVDFAVFAKAVVDVVSSVRSIMVSVLFGGRGWRWVEPWASGSEGPLSEGEGTLCVLESILRVIPLILGVDSDPLEGSPYPKPNKSEKSTALSFPLLWGGPVSLKALPAD